LIGDLFTDRVDAVVEPMDRMKQGVVPESEASL